jgi:hypothetical protein
MTIQRRDVFREVGLIVAEDTPGFRTRVSVDLPAPLGPSTPKIVPGATERLTPSSACTFGG